MAPSRGLPTGPFLFYPNSEGRNGRGRAVGRRAARVFVWSATGPQVRVYGSVRKVRRDAAAGYFAGRPRGSQLSAAASRQSRVVRSREALEKRVLELAAQHPDEVPLPKD